MGNIYPFLFEPVFKDYIWGGRHLAGFGRKLPPDGNIAESWEIAAHPDGMTIVRNGELAGRTLAQLVEAFGMDLMGTHNRWAWERDKFPWLVKLLDANQPLSVQVHPNDAFAQVHEGNELGKTEMWVVLAAEPEAAIIYGLAKRVTPDAFKATIHEGRLDPLLNRVPIHVGDSICVPSGTLHAVLKGAVLVEIQQNSNTTYRVYDWGRPGKDGQPRPLHLEKALQVINFDQVGLTLQPPEKNRLTDQIMRETLCSNAYFTTERLTMGAGAVYEGVCDGGSMEIWSLLQGKAKLSGVALEAVNFALLPANMGGYQVQSISDALWLRTFAG
jgi:mannose-6-phosphate isomerase